MLKHLVVDILVSMSTSRFASDKILTVCIPRKSRKRTVSHWVDWAVDSQSEAAVSGKVNHKEAANHSKAANNLIGC